MKTIDLLRNREAIFNDRIDRSEQPMNIKVDHFKVDHFSETPSRAQIRAASVAEIEKNAIAAWDTGNLAAALAWVGAAKTEEVTVQGNSVWLYWTEAPSNGNSPRPVERTSKLGGSSTAACTLAAHILTTIR